MLPPNKLLNPLLICLCVCNFPKITQSNSKITTTSPLFQTLHIKQFFWKRIGWEKNDKKNQYPTVGQPSQSKSHYRVSTLGLRLPTRTSIRNIVRLWPCCYCYYCPAAEWWGSITLRTAYWYALVSTKCWAVLLYSLISCRHTGALMQFQWRIIVLYAAW